MSVWVDGFKTNHPHSQQFCLNNGIPIIPIFFRQVHHVRVPIEGSMNHIDEIANFNGLILLFACNI